MTEQQVMIETPDEIVARPDFRYRGKHILFSAIIFAVGFWFMYDGYIGWPGHNKELSDLNASIRSAQAAGDSRKVDELKAKLADMHREYTATDINIQKVLGFGLPVAGLLYGIWTARVTRGQFRLSGHTLSIPGHGDIEMADIQSIDKTKWDRKGIAVVRYIAHHPRRERSFKLDDFAYERGPTDQILERIENYLAPPPEMPPEEAAPQTA